MRFFFLWILLSCTGIAQLAWADCESICAQNKSPSTQLGTQCEALKQVKEARLPDQILSGIDGAIVAGCTAACAQIAIPGVGAISGAACDVAAAMDSVGDMVTTLILAKEQGSFGTDTLVGMIGDGLGLGQQVYSSVRDIRASAAASKQAAQKAAEDSAKKILDKIATTKASTRGMSCLTAAMMAFSLSTRITACINDQTTYEQTCASIDRLMPSGASAGLQTGATSGAAGGTATVTSSVSAGVVCGASSCSSQGKNVDVLTSASPMEQKAVAAAGGVGNLMSVIPDQTEFMRDMQSGNAAGAMAQLIPPDAGGGNDLADEVAALMDEMQDLQDQGGLPGLLDALSGGPEEPGLDSTFMRSGAAKKVSNEEDTLLTTLISFLNPLSNATEKDGVGVSKQKGKVMLRQFGRHLAAVGKRGATGAVGGLGLGIFHDQTQMSLFAIVSHRVQSESDRLLGQVAAISK